MAASPKLLALAGSLRKDSFNKKLIRIAARAAQEAGGDVTLIDLRDYPLPIFDQDLEAEQGMPAPAAALKKLMIEQDGFLIAPPEYNSSITAVLKNAIDIGSRPYGKSSFNGRPIGIFGTSPGAHGGVSAVKHLQQILPGISGPIMQHPEAYAGMLGDAFDATGELTKDSLKQFLTTYVQAFAAWVEQLHRK